jgi:hypothetical protein
MFQTYKKETMSVEGAKKFGHEWNITVESNPIFIKKLHDKLSAKSKWINFFKRIN